MPDHARDAVVYLDREGTVQWLNRKGSELLRRSMTEVIGRPFLTFLTPQSAALAGARLEAAQREQPVEPRVELELVSSPGRSRRVEVHEVAVREGGTTAGRLLLIRPVGE